MNIVKKTRRATRELGVRYDKSVFEVLEPLLYDRVWKSEYGGIGMELRERIWTEKPYALTPRKEPDDAILIKEIMELTDIANNVVVYNATIRYKESGVSIDVYCEDESLKTHTDVLLQSRLEDAVTSAWLRYLLKQPVVTYEQ